MTVEQYVSLHECEEVELRLTNSCDYKLVAKFFSNLGAFQEEGVFFLKRDDFVEPWQQGHYAAIEPLTDKDYSTCHRVWFSCLVSEITEAQVYRFLDLLANFSENFEGQFIHRSLNCQHDDLMHLFLGYIEEIRSEWDFMAGDKELVELINSPEYCEAQTEC